MNWFLRGALGLVLAASAGCALAQVYGPPPAGYPPAYDPPLAGGPGYAQPRHHDDMPGPDRRVGGRYDVSGYDREGYDAYGFDQRGVTRDGYDLYGYDERGYDRYGRRAPPRYADDRPRFDDRARHADDDRYARDDRYAQGGDRYGPRDDWDEPADGYYVPSFGGALQHYADPRCNTCRVAMRVRDCGCTGSGLGALTLGSDMFYDYGGVGPIPDGGYYGGGGGYFVMSGAGARSSASASAFASSSSRVSIRVGGHGHMGGGHKGGCGSCGGHH